MFRQPLTVTEALRYANHDFLNDLQLIQMNLDLERVDDARKIIQQITAECRTNANLSRLKMPLLHEWLLTVKWRFNALQCNISSNVDASEAIHLDAEIVQYLENTMIHIYDKLDPYFEQHIHIHIESTKETFKITVHFNGRFEIEPFHETIQQLKVQTYEQTNTSWKYVLERN